jgi:hypothetical protein
MSLDGPFKKNAKIFTEKFREQKDLLEQCLARETGKDINVVCEKQKSEYLFGIAQIFCKKEYDTAVKCQKAAKDEWASECFDQNVSFGQCADSTLKKLYVYNMMHSSKAEALEGNKKS